MKTLILFLLLAVNLHAGISFDGTDDYLSVSDATHPTEYTMAAWVYIPSPAARSIIFRTDGGSLPSTSFSHTIRVTAASKFEHYTFDGAIRTITGTTTISANTWYHVAATAKNGGNCRLYVNGVEEGSATGCTTLWASGTRYLVAAANAGTSSYYAGRVGDVFICNKEFTAAEVLALYNARLKYHPLQIQASSLRWYWPLDDFADGATVTGASSIVDRSGGGRHGTPNNSPTAKAEECLSYP